MSKQYDDTNRGALFRDNRKTKEADRDYSGNLNVGGREYWLSGWIKTSKKGEKYLSLSVKAKGEKPTSTTEKAEDDFGDEIPF